MGRSRGGKIWAAGLGLALAVGSLGACGSGSGSGQEEPTAACDREGCTGIPLEQIEEISGLTLPEGTEVLESSYIAFQDWILTATLLLPEGAEDPLAASGLEWSSGTGDEEGVFRSADSREVDGRLELRIGVSTQ